MLINLFKSNNFYKKEAFLIALILIISLILVAVNTGSLLRVALNTILVLFLPGYLIIKLFPNLLNLRNYEKIPVAIALSVAIATLLATYLAFYIYYLTALTAVMAVIIVCIFIILLAAFYHKKELKSTGKNNYDLLFISLGIAVLAIIIPLATIMKWKYPIGWDTWIIKPIVKSIIEGDGFKEPGYYNLLAFFNLITTFSIDRLVRYSSPFFLALSSMLTFFLVLRISMNKNIAILSTFFFITSGQIIRRFTMALRENFNFPLLIAFFLLMFIIFKKERVEKKDLILPIFLSSV
ncbi:MAG: hypothetical protein ACD_12C00043G0001, partial [uncultured bacterium]